MRIIKPYTEILLERNPLKKIETIGRVCYKSEDKITSKSYERFIGMLISAKHEAMLEHGSFIFEIGTIGDTISFEELVKSIEHLLGVKVYLRITHNMMRRIVSGNVRAWRDFFKYCRMLNFPIPIPFKDFFMKYKLLFGEFLDGEFNYDYVNNNSRTAKGINEIPLVTLEEYYHKGYITTEQFYSHYDVSVKFVVDRGVSHELVRHRDASFAQESTRYCNYANEKFNSELTFIKPIFFVKDTSTYKIWEKSMQLCEEAYFELLDIGCLPQESRDVLCNSIKTEVYMTANLREWVHFFELRAIGTTGKPHPQMTEVTVPLLKTFQNDLKLLNELKIESE